MEDVIENTEPEKTSFLGAGSSVNVSFSILEPLSLLFAIRWIFSDCLFSRYSLSQTGMILGVICMKFLKLCQCSQVMRFRIFHQQIKLMRIASLRL